MAEQKSFIDELFSHEELHVKMDCLSTTHEVSTQISTGLLRLKTNLVRTNTDDGLVDQIDTVISEVEVLTECTKLLWNKLMQGDG